MDNMMTYIDPEEKANFTHNLAIQTMNLTRKYGLQTAVDHINLQVSYGKIFGLLGPNGAGKSTTIKMLTTILDPSSGTATVAGFNVVAGSENFMLSAKLFRMPRAERSVRIFEAKQFTGLENSANKFVKT